MAKRFSTSIGSEPQQHYAALASIASGLVIAAATMPAAALDTHLEVGAAAEHHSNVERTAQDKQADTIEVLLARLGLQHDGPNLQALVDYDLENRRYAQDTFDNENAINGRASLDWKVWQEHIDLLVDHTVDTTVANSSQPDTPSNRTRRSVLAAGPRFTARLSQVDDLQLTARKVDITVKDSADSASTQPNPNDSERDEVTLQWNHQLSENRALYLGTSYADVSFDEVPLQDYRYTATFAGLNLASRPLELALQAGVNKAERKEGTLKDTDGKTLSIDMRTRDRSSPIQASAYYLKAITDTSVGFVGQGALPEQTSSAENLDIVDIVEREQTGVTANFQLGEAATVLTLGASLQKQDYQEQPRDDKTRTYSAQISRQSNAQLLTRAFYDRSVQKLTDDDSEIKTTRFGVGVNYSLSDPVTLRCEAYRLKSDSSTDGLSYDDNVVRLEVTYAFTQFQGAR